MFWKKLITFAVILTVLIYIQGCSSEVYLINKRIAPENNVENFDSQYDSLQNSYDEYPMVVPKRAAMLLDRIMVALHHALEDDKEGNRKISDIYRKPSPGKYNRKPNLISDDFNNDLGKGLYNVISTNDIDDFEVRELKPDNPSIDESRRSQGDAPRGNNNKKYWQCYFNAVSCF